MHICRTRFQREIITEFVPPLNRKSGKVLIFCAGVPGVPHKDEVLAYWAKKGYWTFFPRYRGTWESKGSFLKDSPEQDVLDVLKGLDKSFKDFWSGKTFRVHAKSINIVGSSFGGPAAILASRNARVNKVVCISPVVDWQAEDKADPLTDLYQILHDGYGDAYRLKKSDWNKLAKGKFYNPLHHIQELDARKIMIFHAENDEIVRFKPVQKFVKKLGCKLIKLKHGGHLSSSMLMTPRYFKMVSRFISGKID